jgi:alkanesulfonate monooxygenase SsuD/methylene tetrahydromethanopterin reductase-like flavin-dependent oxidoreductase (luciferase family)
MNKEETRKAIEVMQAYVDGEQIELQWSVGEWETYDHDGKPTWNWSKYDYRIKPKPREWWLDLNIGRFHADVEKLPDGNHLIKVREVLE